MGMAKIDTTSLDEAARPPKSDFMTALGGPQFVVAQIFTILATVLGVYLAGYVGYQRTLQYDQFVKAQQRADLLQALQAELKHNTGRLRAFVGQMQKTQEGIGIYQDWPRLRLYVWRAAGQTETVFDAPPQTLADMQAFYEDVGEMLGDAEAKKMFRSLTTSNEFDRRKLTERLDGYVKMAETALLPSLDQAAAASAELAAQKAGPAP
jgi:hypothetical protein